ncbi:MAG: hypothetical protein NVSMB1_22610 [Polyangiales bacterium]
MSIAFAALVAGCVVVDTSPSPIDNRLAPPSSPAIDAHYDLIFNGVLCTPGSPVGVSTWSVKVLGSAPRESGRVSCWDPLNNIPFAVRFDGLTGAAPYDLEATAFIGERACYTARCTARTTAGPYGVLPACSVTRTC